MSRDERIMLATMGGVRLVCVCVVVGGVGGWGGVFWCSVRVKGGGAVQALLTPAGAPPPPPSAVQAVLLWVAGDALGISAVTTAMMGLCVLLLRCAGRGGGMHTPACPGTSRWLCMLSS